MARSPIIIDPSDHHEPTPTIPGLPDEDIAEERPTGPGLGTDHFFNAPTAVPISEPTPVSVEAGDDDWEELPPPPSTGIPDWAPVLAMCLCAAVGTWALVDRFLS